MSDLATALVFWPSVAIMLATGLYVFRTSSMARAGLLLLASLGVEGLIFLALNAEFLGVLLLLMMSGEMVIMVFFMVMFMADPGGLMGMDMTHDKRRSAGASMLVCIALAVVAAVTEWPARAAGIGTPDLEQIGFQVMGPSMFSFLFAGVTILFAMVGGIMLAKFGGRLDLPTPGNDDTAGHDHHDAAHAHHGHGGAHS